MTRLRDVSAIRWTLAGLILGALTQPLLSQRSPGTNASIRNTVVLRGEMTVTIEKLDCTIPEAAIELSKQTGYTLTIDKSILGSNSKLGFVLRDVPFRKALSGLAYLTGGVWDHSGMRYHLRPQTLNDVTLDPTEYADELSKMRDYLSGVDTNDPNLTPAQALSINAFLAEMDKPSPVLPSAPNEAMRNWKVDVNDHSVMVSYPDPSGTGGRGVLWSYASGRPR